MDYDTSAEKDKLKRVQMPEFASETEETWMLKDKCIFRTLVKKSEDMKTHSGTWVNHLESRLQNQFSMFSTTIPF